jgi:putative spermidine/putrescine transport system substrate-binding protein
MTRRCVHPLAIALALASAVSAPAVAQELVIHSPAGSFQTSMDICFGQPFNKQTGAKIGWVQGGSVAAAARIRAAAGKPDIDVAYMDMQIANQPKGEGLLEKIDFSQFKNAAEVLPGTFDPDGILITIMVTGTMIAYNPKEVSPPPTSWNDFFNPKFRGRVGIGDLQNTSGYAMLIALARLNGGNEAKIDPGFDGMKKLMPSVGAVYTQADQLIALFERGDVVIAPWYPDRAGRAADDGAPVAVVWPKEGGIGTLGTLSIPKGTKNLELAKKFIDFAVSEEGQKCFAERQYAATVNKKVKLNDKTLSLVPNGKTMDELYMPDFKVVAVAAPNWTERWRRELQR